MSARHYTPGSFVKKIITLVRQASILAIMENVLPKKTLNTGRILALTLFLKFKHLFIDAYVMRNGLVKTALNEFLISAFAKMVALAQPWKTLINANVRMVLSVNFVSTSVDLPINQCHRFFHGEFLIWNVLLTTVKMSLPQLNNKFTNLLSGLLPET